MNIVENESLAKYTSFKIGGPAKYFTKVKNEKDLLKALAFAKEKGISFFVLGEGTNLLIDDKGLNKLIVKIDFSDFNILGNNVVAGAGCKLISLIFKASEAGLTGMEELAGIPGSVGGAIWANAGAFRKDISMFIKKVKVLRGNDIIELSKEDCGFSYRNSIFKDKDNNDIIISAEFELEKGDINSSKEKIKQILDKRTCSQPLSYPSAGCFFQNYKIKENETFAQEILPEFLEKQVIPAAWLIEQSGLKGFTTGGAQVSDIHANFIINRNNATFSDVLNIAREVENKVFEKFKIKLEKEVKVMTDG